MTAIILAAGKSTRMNSDRPKVLHDVCGRPMLHHVLAACRDAGADRLAVVVGHGREAVIDAMGGAGGIRWIEQVEQKGTGHAVQCCRAALADATGSLLVVAGDMPLVRRATLANLYETREHNGDAAVIATTVLEDPTGYGRIIRNADGGFEAIVEHRDCTPSQRAVREVNPSYYCFDAAKLFAALDDVTPDNAKGEYYLTDAVTQLQASGAGVSAIPGVAAEDAMGVNSRVDLASVNRVMQDRIQMACMRDGVTIVDPDNTWIEVDAVIGRDTVVMPFTFVGSGARIGCGCRVGPHACVAAGDTVADGAVVGAASCREAGELR
ncbi:MAG: NTP transferase domain-containing protein [Phycisphaerae bacterium]